MDKVAERNRTVFWNDIRERRGSVLRLTCGGCMEKLLRQSCFMGRAPVYSTGLHKFMLVSYHDVLHVKPALAKEIIDAIDTQDRSAFPDAIDRERFVEALLSGALTALVEEHPVRPLDPMPVPVPKDEKDEDEALTPRPTWIALEVRGTQGERFPQARVRVRLPSGETRSGGLREDQTWQAHDLATGGVCEVEIEELGSPSAECGEAPPEGALEWSPGGPALEVSTGQSHTIVVTAPAAVGDLEVVVYATPFDSPAPGALVMLQRHGAVVASGHANEDGLATFSDLSPGFYEVFASWGDDAKDPMVEAALQEVGSELWAKRRARDPYPAGANKCNLFVYEMALRAGRNVPRMTRFSLSQFSEVWHPPLARDWASDGALGPWVKVNTPRPGDTIAIPHDYSNATGHVGIVAYPEQATSQQAEVRAGEGSSCEVPLLRRTISAGAYLVLYNDWGYRSDQVEDAVFKRYE